MTFVTGVQTLASFTLPVAVYTAIGTRIAVPGNLVVEEVAGSLGDDPSRIAMVDCVIAIGQDLITQTHVKFAAMQGVVAHRVRGRTVIGARVVFHTREHPSQSKDRSS